MHIKEIKNESRLYSSENRRPEGRSTGGYLS